MKFVALRLTLCFMSFCTLACTIMDINIIRTTTSIYCAREIRRIEMSRCPVASFYPIKIWYRLPEKSKFSGNRLYHYQLTKPKIWLGIGTKVVRGSLIVTRFDHFLFISSRGRFFPGFIPGTSLIHRVRFWACGLFAGSAFTIWTVFDRD